MKSIKSIIFLSAALCLAACAPEEKIGIGDNPKETGVEDVIGEGVYFAALTQEQKAMVLDPADETTVEFAVYRKTEDHILGVPLEIIATANGEPVEGIFEVSDILFGVGQTETTVRVSFPNAEIGTTYSCTIQCTDPTYAGQYGDQPLGLTFSVIRERWVSLGTGIWTESGEAYFNNFSEEVEILQNEMTPTLFRARMKWLDEKGETYAVYSGDNDEYFEFRVLTPGETFRDVKITRDDIVAFSSFNTGYIDTNYPGDPVYYLHPSSFTNLRSEDAWAESHVFQWQDNGLPAGVAFAPYCYLFGAGGGWNFTEVPNAITLSFPGAKLVDYSLEIEALGVASKGQLPVAFYLGEDIVKCKYAAYEGVEEDVNAKVKEIIADADAAFVEQSDTLGLSFEKTGVYTLVAVGLDAEGVAQAAASTVVSYSAAEGEMPVVLSCGIGSAEKYAPKGISTDNSVEFFLYGSELVDVKVIACSKADIASNQQGCIKSVLAAKSLSPEALAAVNGDGYVGVISGLLPGTEYYILAYGSNGFEEGVFLSSSSQFTTGDPLPVYLNYTSADLQSDLLTSDPADLYGKYNFYGVNGSNKSGLREYLSKATIEDSGIPSASDSLGVYYYPAVKGMLAGYDKMLGFEDKIVFEHDGGLLWQQSIELGEGQFKGNTYYFKACALDSDGYFYGTQTYAFVGIPVAEGYIAFVPNPTFVSNYNVTFTGMQLIGFAEDTYTTAALGVDTYENMLLVREDVDNNGLAPKAKTAALNNMVKPYTEALRNLPMNYVQTDKQRVLSAIESVRENYACGSIAPIRGTRSCEKASFSVSEMPSFSKSGSRKLKTNVNVLSSFGDTLAK